MATRVFLLDDHEVVRWGIRELLEGEDDLEVVGEAATVGEALSALEAAQPDVAVLDMRLPDGNGTDVCREIRHRYPSVRCVMLTSFADEDTLSTAQSAGAAAYVLKNVGGRQLVESVRRVARGETLIGAGPGAGLDAGAAGGPSPSGAGGRDVSSLSSQERRILEFIADGCTNREIGEAMFLAEKTVKNYVSAVLSKLGMSRRTEAAVYATRLAERRRREQPG